MNHDQEGVIKFRLNFEKADVVTFEMIVELTKWRDKLFSLKLIGQNPALYDGLSYGNVSHRLNPNSSEYVITGSQTSHLPTLKPEHYAIVTESHISENRLVARGLTKPSSEALTHAAFYQVSNAINYVFHVHSADIWNNAARIGIPTTDPSIAYGTPEMAEEIENLYKSGKLASNSIIAMGGHRDGIIAFGDTALNTGKSIIDILEKYKI